MRKIKLLKDHEMNGVIYKEGEEIEVEDWVYDYIVNAYLEERKQLNADLEVKEQTIVKKGRK